MLIPFSVLYGVVTAFRNFMFDRKILKSSSFDVKTILVGNISAGGTGKTPHIEYLIRLLKPQNKLATLSRGYGRKSRGFLVANQNSTAKDIGDEPLQFFKKFPEVKVAVDTKRVNGIMELMSQEDVPEVILVDDAFQHRQLKAGLSILLTDVKSPFYKDFMLPTGNLREFSGAKSRADIIVVTKCSPTMSAPQKDRVRKKINMPHTPIFFSQIDYAFPKLISKNTSQSFEDSKQIVVVTGIANPAPLLTYLSTFNKKIIHLKYQDHHPFSKKDVHSIVENYNKESESILLTTEKDAMRLKDFDELKEVPFFYIPIQVSLQEREEEFKKLIMNYVREY